jgi:3-phosphoshikimate 1-carboxyvinyltransferase
MPARPIRPARHDLDVVVRLPGSKSVTNRALLLAALAQGDSVVLDALEADDTSAFIDGLRALGVGVERQAAGRLAVEGAAGRLPACRAAVDCRDAGTAARFLLAACAAAHGVYTVDGSPQLRRRPMGALLRALETLGAGVEPAAAERLPVTLTGRGLRGGELRLPGDVSSQFVSALLMAAPLGAAPLGLRVDGPVSRPYIDMTVAMMRDFGVAVEREAHERFTVPAPAAYTAREYAVEPDASTASYFFAAAAVTGGRVTVEGLRRDGALQGDVRFVDVLEAMGAEVRDTPQGLQVAGKGLLNGLTVDMGDIPDTFMTLAAIAPFALAPVTITGVGNVRLKESDRIAAVEENLRGAGIRVESGPDSLRVIPGTPHAAEIDPRGDHRIAMSFAVTGLRSRGLAILDPDCVAKTCPGFFDLWRRLERSGAAEDTAG